MIEGELDGPDQAAVIERLHQMGHTPIRADAVSGAQRQPFLQRSLFAGGRISRRELALFTREMATLLGAGLTLERALEILGDLSDRDSVRRLITRLVDAIRGGSSFADALAGRGDVFPGYYISMVRAGEAGGALDVVLERLSEFMERAQALRESVRSALVYPMIVVVMAGAAVTVMLTVVLPQFTPLFEDAGEALPPLTRVVVAAGDAIRDYWWLGLALVALLIVFGRQQMANPTSRARWDALFLRTPLFGDLIAKAETARFSRTLGTLLANGVPMLGALGIVKETLVNSATRRAVVEIGNSLKEGEGLAGPLANATEFPALSAQLVRVGEETGRLEEMLFKIADIFDREVGRSVDRMLALMVPGLTLALGGLIAVIIGAILSAMFSVYDLPF
jgi:general secretion pathway protein F